MYSRVVSIHNTSFRESIKQHMQVIKHLYHIITSCDAIVFRRSKQHAAQNRPTGNDHLVSKPQHDRQTSASLGRQSYIYIQEKVAHQVAHQMTIILWYFMLYATFLQNTAFSREKGPQRSEKRPSRQKRLTAITPC